ncbi:hypothetical protein [Candidatus Frankia nodulisporulans]|uniref:hypothetical protein n=1 Tax=Candidatus Frankia nodulisporulans TaxID=2060052 RepID=UPI001582F29D|nr:hypothetical protein [Candidatus Frankia nodulisporulans]
MTATGRRAGSETQVERIRVDLDDQIVLDCVVCGDERSFERPPCLDGHGADCPEWACTGCGSAVLIGPTPNIRGHRRGHAGRDGVLVREPSVRETTTRETGTRETGTRETGTRETAARGRERSAPRIPA